MVYNIICYKIPYPFLQTIPKQLRKQIDIIGDLLIRKKMLQMYDDYLEDNRIEQEIKFYEEKIEELRLRKDVKE